MGGLALTAQGPVQAGEPVTISLSLYNAGGEAVTPVDLALVHDKKLHVMIVDEGLEDYAHAHPEADADGNFSVTFTPKFERAYRVWTDFTIADKDATPTNDHHAAPAGTPMLAAATLGVGEKETPAVDAKSVSFVDAGALRFRLWTDGEIKTGEPVRMRVSVSDENGAPFKGLEPLMGAYAHLVGFDEGATAMAHAHPSGVHPHGADSRGGPDLAFDVTLDEPGPHRLFLQTKKDGEEG